MKCANCGNEDLRTLFDEGDTFYCSKCCHRTQTATGQDDLITCPFCGRLRDRKAMYCMWCNNVIGSEPGPSKEEYEELDTLLNEFEAGIDDSNMRYGKLKVYPMSRTTLGVQVQKPEVLWYNDIALPAGRIGQR